MDFRSCYFSPLKLEWLSEELQQVLDKHHIELLADTAFVRNTNAAVMYAAYNRYTHRRVICVITWDLFCIGLTHAETEAVIWHEVAHCLFGASEKEADDYAIAHSSGDVWTSAIRKVYCIGGTPYGEYAHRSVYFESDCR